MTEGPPLHSIRARAALATGAAALLVSGYVLRPEAELPSTPAEQPSPILREVVTRRQTTGLFAPLQETARRVVGVTARLTFIEPPPDGWSDWKPRAPRDSLRFGVPIDPSRILGDAADLEPGAQVAIRLGNGRSLQGRVGARYPASGLAIVETDTADALPLPAVSASPAAPGDLVVGVAPGEEGPVVVPLVVAETSRGAIRVAGETDRFLGIAAFSAGGEWLGVLAGGPDGTRILPVDAVLSEPAETGTPPPLGISLRTVVRDGTPQIVVEDLAPDGRADAAGLRAGDVLVSVNDQPADALEGVAAALQLEPDQARRIRVRRGNRSVVVQIPPAADSR